MKDGKKIVTSFKTKGSIKDTFRSKKMAKKGLKKA